MSEEGGLTTNFWISQAIFIVTGVTQNVLSYQVGQIGLTKEPWNLINVYFNYIGQELCCILYDYRTPKKTTWKSITQFRNIAVCNVLGAINYYIGLQLIGSGLLSVLYSFIIVVCALFNRFFFNKHLSIYIWITLLIITAGIAVCSVSEVQSGGNIFEMVGGIATAILATVCYGGSYTLINTTFENGDAPEQHVGAFAMGVWAMGFCVVYFLVVGIPMWNPWIRDPVLNADEEATWQNILMYSMLLILINGTHQVSSFYCLSFGKVANITTGVSKALQAAATFIVSSIIYCNRDKKQCMNTEKDIGVTITCIGILAYSYFSLMGGSKEESKDRYQQLRGSVNAEDSIVPVSSSSFDASVEHDLKTGPANSSNTTDTAT